MSIKCLWRWSNHLYTQEWSESGADVIQWDTMLLDEQTKWATPSLGWYPNPRKQVFTLIRAHSLETFHFINKQIRQQESITNSAKKKLSYYDDDDDAAAGGDDDAADNNPMFMKLFKGTKVYTRVPTWESNQKLFPLPTSLLT